MAETIRGYDFALGVARELSGDRLLNATVDCTPLAGGLEASAVNLLTVRFQDRLGRAQMLRMVLKELNGSTVREASIYQSLAARYASGLSPRLLGIKQAEQDGAFLCIEAVRRASAWPWRNTVLAGDMLRGLAKFHMEAKTADAAIPVWDFEAQLTKMAEMTWAAVDRCRSDPFLQPLARGLPAVKRLLLQQPRLRDQLLGEAPFGCGPIHGDVHPGNALARRRQNSLEPILLDWGRARIGSPIEDVGSWLQSLGCWEREAKRGHDRLLCDYLSAIGEERKLTSGVRAAYWIAGARNALAGALLHSICAAEDRHRKGRERMEACQAAYSWLRVIRRADAWSRD